MTQDAITYHFKKIYKALKSDITPQQNKMVFIFVIIKKDSEISFMHVFRKSRDIAIHPLKYIQL
jgi:hypothetical protein